MTASTAPPSTRSHGAQMASPTRITPVPLPGPIFATTKPPSPKLFHPNTHRPSSNSSAIRSKVPPRRTTSSSRPTSPSWTRATSDTQRCKLTQRRARAAYDTIQSLHRPLQLAREWKMGWHHVCRAAELRVFEMPRAATLADASAPLPAPHHGFFNSDPIHSPARQVRRTARYRLHQRGTLHP